MAPLSPTHHSPKAANRGDGDDERRRHDRQRAMDKAALAHKQRFAKQRRHSKGKERPRNLLAPNPGNHDDQRSKGKGKARAPVAPATDDDDDGDDDSDDDEVDAGSNGVFEAAEREARLRFEEELAQLRKLHQNDQRVAAQSARNTPGASGSVSSPGPATSPISDRKRTKLKIDSIRRECGMEGPKHKRTWNELSTAIRDAMAKVGLEWDLPWKQQSPMQLGLLYSAIEQENPILAQFKNSWATSVLVQNKFNNRKAYKIKMSNEDEDVPPANPRPRKKRCAAPPESALAGLTTIEQSPARSISPGPWPAGPPPGPASPTPVPHAPAPAPTAVEPAGPVRSGSPSAPASSPKRAAASSINDSERPKKRPTMRPVPPPSETSSHGATVAPASTSHGAEDVPASTPAPASLARPASKTRASLSRTPSMTVTVELPRRSSSRGQGSGRPNAGSGTENPPVPSPGSPSPAGTVDVPAGPQARSPRHRPEPESATPSEPRAPRYPVRQRNPSAGAAARQTAAAIAVQQKKQKKVVQRAGRASGNGKGGKPAAPRKAAATKKAAASKATATGKGEETTLLRDESSPEAEGSSGSDSVDDGVQMSTDEDDDHEVQAGEGEAGEGAE